MYKKNVNKMIFSNHDIGRILSPVEMEQLGIEYYSKYYDQVPNGPRREVYAFRSNGHVYPLVLERLDENFRLLKVLPGRRSSGIKLPSSR